MKLEWSDGIIYEKGGKFKYPTHDGVYVIATKKNGEKIAQYVGQGNIYERMKAHESDDEQNSCLKTVMKDRDNLVVYYAEIPKQTELDNAERTLVDYFGIDDLCNEQLPMGEFDPSINAPFLKEMA
jgi:hypothetical protein